MLVGKRCGAMFLLGAFIPLTIFFLGCVFKTSRIARWELGFL